MQRRHFVALFGSLSVTGVLGTDRAFAEDPQLVEPIHRVANAASVTSKPMIAQHPLDRALEMAQDALTHCRANVNDYTAILVKRERVGDTLGDYEYMYAKVRNRK
ncbi:secreted protein containing, partial [Rhodopirellula maiorica SM1]